MDNAHIAKLIQRALEEIYYKQKDLSFLDDAIHDHQTFFHVIPKGHLHQGKSLFLVTCMAAVYEAPEAFIRAWYRFRDNCKPEDLVVSSEEQLFPLYHLAVAASQGVLSPFMLVWREFNLDLKASQFTEKKYPPSMLWHLAESIGKSPDAFEAVWNKFGSDITMDDVREKNTDDSPSILWLSAYHSTHHPLLFKAVWDQVKKDICPGDLKARAKLSFHTHSFSALRVISHNAFINKCPTSITVLKEILAQIPDIFTKEDLEEGKAEKRRTIASLAQAPSAVWAVDIVELVKVRNEFFENLNLLKVKLLNLNKTMSKNEWIKISGLALRATNAGYLSAWFDLGKVLYDSNDFKYAQDALKNTPDTSWRYFSALELADNIRVKIIKRKFSKELQLLMQNHIDKPEIISKEKWHTLSSLALNATHQGYLNAWYDLGISLYQSGDFYYAGHALFETPKESPYYQKAQNILNSYLDEIESLYIPAIQEGTPRKIALLIYALELSLALPLNYPYRIDNIKKIAFSYFKLKGCNLAFWQAHELPTVLDRILQEKISISDCLAYFDKIIEMMTKQDFDIRDLEKAIKTLKLENDPAEKIGETKAFLNQFKKYSSSTNVIERVHCSYKPLSRSQ